MANPKIRGSEKLMNAWKSRTLTEESLREIGKALDDSPARVEDINIVGGEHATGLQLTLAYEGDDIPRCGNDISFWLNWLRKHGGEPRVPRWMIDGKPWPELVKVKLDFGDVTPGLPLEIEQVEQVFTRGG